MCLSVPQMAAAATRISTSSARGSGTGQSRISVPDTPSTGEDLTTACMASGGGCYHLRSATACPENLLHQSRLIFAMLCRREVVCKSPDDLHHRGAVAIPQVLVQSALHAIDLLARRSAGLVHRVGHPARARRVFGAVKNQQRDAKRAQRSNSVECRSAQEIQRQPR